MISLLNGEPFKTHPPDNSLVEAQLFVGDLLNDAVRRCGAQLGDRSKHRSFVASDNGRVLGKSSR